MNKGMPLWEQHLEKFVLGLAVVMLLGVLAMTLLGGSEISADIDGRTYGASEVDDVMAEKAQELGRRLSPDADADTTRLEGIDADGSGRFESRLSASVSPRRSLPRTAPALAAVLLPEEVGAIDVWYHEPGIPAPRIHSEVEQTVDTVASAEFERVAGLSSAISENGDVTWATPSAMIDLAAIRRELEVQDDRATPSRNRIPSNWYNARPYVLDVVFERQQLQDDGQWGGAEIVDTLPGAMELRTRIRAEREGDGLNASFKEFVWTNLDDPVKQLEVLQPEFYETLNGRWTIPDGDASEADEDDSPAVDEEEAARRREEQQLIRRIEDKRALKARKTVKLEELGGPLREEDDEASGGRGRGSSGGGGRSSRGGGQSNPDGGAPGFGSGAGRKSGDAGGSPLDRRRRLALTREVEQLADEIKRLQERLEELNPDSDSLDEEDGAVESLPDLAQVDEVQVWGHDLGVVPGETYRYRCRVELFNPFFARGRQLLPDQQSLAEPFEIPSQSSEWSDPITIDPPVSFWVVQATASDGDLGLGEARFEVYRYFEGALRSERFVVEPGERIGGPAVVDGVSVDFSTDWYLVDVVDDPAAPESSALDREDNATVICRRVDDIRRQVKVPSQERDDLKRLTFEFDADSAEGRN